MADIRVERSRSNVWMWIVALIVIALAIWALAAMFSSNRNETRRPTVDAVGVNVAPSAPLAAALPMG